MEIKAILDSIHEGRRLFKDELLYLYRNAPLSELIYIADGIRMKKHPEGRVGWIIDRNVNITNICSCRCKFCNFHRVKGASDIYITSMDQYREKIKELRKLGGNQLLLQGGMHPDLGVDFYENLFSDLKKIDPEIKLHALGPPEIVWLSKKDKLSYLEVLQRLVASGLDSLPGAGAEILSDRVRKIVSPAKCSSKEWFDVMRVAHSINLTTSATMMFGHAETDEERIDHLIAVREVQDEKPVDANGFIAFIPWPFQDEGTKLKTVSGITNNSTISCYVRLIAISRIALDNVNNIQASWLTVGPDTASLCLHAGANDMGSIMIEENVVSSAGASYALDADGIQRVIAKAGFTPAQRDQQYNYYSG